jgi:hypothetical protein
VALRDRFERAIGLGRSDDPRAHVVGGAGARADARPIASVPGARVRIRRRAADGAVGRLIVALHRRGVAFEIVEAGESEPSGVWIDGRAVSPADARRPVG